MADEINEVTMPKLGETVTEGTLGRWLKEVGEPVAGPGPSPTTSAREPAGGPGLSRPRRRMSRPGGPGLSRGRGRVGGNADGASVGGAVWTSGPPLGGGRSRGSKG